jgi:uncharacterized iron-regulated membrane protein
MPPRSVVVKIHLDPSFLRKLILKIHLYLGLTAGVFLVILGITGSIMAFENEIDHWLRPELWYVTPRRKPLPENDLVSVAQNRFRPARVFAVQFPRAANLAQVIRMTDATIVYLNPYDGTVLGDTLGLSSTDQFLIYVHQVHLWLIPDPTWAPAFAQSGKIVVGSAALFAVLLVPTGLILWLRDKRLTLRSKAINFEIPWFVYFQDAHHAIGIYASVFIWIASVTGVAIGFNFGEKLIYAVTKSAPPEPLKSFPSMRVPGAAAIMADQVLDVARKAMPGAQVDMMLMPTRPTASFTVLMRVPAETSQNVHSSVTIDQYSGKVLNVRDYRADSFGYRLIRLNRSIHNGDIFGLASHIVVSISSLLLVAMVITGFVMWRKKLAV